MVARNRAGQSDCLPSANSVVDNNDDVDDDDVDDDDDDDVESRHNSHWLPCNNDDDESGPSRWINYYDAASLYPSSGKHTHSYDIIIIIITTLAGSA